MSNFRYQLNGSWYKGNTHSHSTLSDGTKPFEELGKLYRQSGYDFLCLTDHWVASKFNPVETADGLLWFNGIELNGEDARGIEYHIVCLGKFDEIDEKLTLEQALQRAMDQDGFIILAHPFWTGNSLEDCLRFPFHAVEVFNYVCQCEIGKGDGLVHWNHVLEKSPHTLGIASDDAHFSSDSPMWKGGWVMVNAAERSHAAIQAALRAGNYYSTSGPEFHSIICQDDRVRVETSPVQFIRLVGPKWKGHGRAVGMRSDTPITTAEFKIPSKWAYAYLEIEDQQHRRAWTNTLFVE
jgi:hypothetical protein